jgi:predicted Zn-dependent protease
LILGDKAAQARQLLRKSLLEHPDSIEIKEALGQLLNSKSMRHEGISILEEVMQAKRGRILIRTLGCLTTLYFDTRRFEDCIRMAKRILDRAESKEKAFIETYVRTQLVMAYAFSGSWGKAKYEFGRLPLDAVLFEDRGYWQYGDIKSFIEKIGGSNQKRNKSK